MRAAYKRLIFLPVFIFFLWQGRAFADLLEIQGEGFVNGDIVSEDDASITLKDAKGGVHTIPKSKVLLREQGNKKSGLDRIKEDLSLTARKVKQGTLAAISKVPTIPLPDPAKSAPFNPGGGRQADLDLATREAQDMTELMAQAAGQSIRQQREMRVAAREEKRSQEANSPPKSRFVSLDDDKK